MDLQSKGFNWFGNDSQKFAVFIGSCSCRLMMGYLYFYEYQQGSKCKIYHPSFWLKDSPQAPTEVSESEAEIRKGLKPIKVGSGFNLIKCRPCHLFRPWTGWRTCFFLNFNFILFYLHLIVKPNPLSLLTPPLSPFSRYRNVTVAKVFICLLYPSAGYTLEWFVKIAQRGVGETKTNRGKEK